MSLNWLFFANLSVVGLVVYLSCFKLSGDHINVFGFMAVLGVAYTAGLALIYGVAKLGLKADIIGDISRRGAICAALAGIAVIIIDIGLFYAFRHGSPVLTNIYYNVGGVIVFTIIGMIFFKETLTLTKTLGILLGAASLVLVAL